MVLKDVIKIDERFQTSVNIRFDIDKTNKIDEFIPAKSTLDVLETYLENIFEKGSDITGWTLWKREITSSSCAPGTFKKQG